MAPSCFWPKERGGALCGLGFTRVWAKQVMGWGEGKRRLPSEREQMRSESCRFSGGGGGDALDAQSPLLAVDVEGAPKEILLPT